MRIRRKTFLPDRKAVIKTMNTEIRALPAQGSRLYFIGIGGISMSSLAMLSLHGGYRVAGSDSGHNAQIDALRAAGVTVYPTHEAAHLEGIDAVIYTSAISEENPELAAARAAHLTCYRRAEYLGALMAEYSNRIGVAGTHGKSTTTSMLTEIFMTAHADPTVVSGAVMREMGGAYRIGGSEHFIFEACEYTDSFLSFCPTVSIVLNVEMDHVDYFHSMEQLRASFARYLGYADIAVVNYDSPEARRAAQASGAPMIASFGLEASDARFRAENILFENGCASFDFCEDGNKKCRITLNVPGKHNVYDALAASTAAYLCGIPTDAIAAGLAVFGGAARRFELKGMLHGARVYDDYAHHPSEIRATLAAARGIGGRVRCVYQPHSYSRTAELFDDFSASFSDADEVIFTDIYINLEAEHGIRGITAADLAAAVPGARYLSDFDEITAYLRETAAPGDLIILMGAGNICAITPRLLDES